MTCPVEGGGRLAGSGQSQRLKTRAEFLAVAKGRRVHSGAFSLQGLPRASGDTAPPRFGLTVTRQTGNAVCRNRIRRRLREVIRLKDTGGESGCDYVIVARPGALNMPFDQLAQELTRSIAALRAGKGSTPGPRKPRKHAKRSAQPQHDQKDQASQS
jgi:ribonuclease P protein component